MKLKRSSYGMITGLLASLLTMVLLNLFVPVGGVAVAQEQPTETPVPTVAPSPTPLASFEIQTTFALTSDGDLNGDGVINPGDTVTYSIDVRNTGAATSGALELVMQYDPAFFSGVAAISDGGRGGQGQVTWSLPGLDAGQNEVVNFAATLVGIFPQGRTQVAGRILLRTGNVELARAAVPSIDVLGPNLRFANPPSFELVTDLDQDGQFDPGDTVRFTISYSNTGGGPSQEASIVADYPDELTPQIVSNPENAEDSGGVLTWLIGSVPADGTVRTVHFAVTFANEFSSGTTTYDLPIFLRSGTTSLDQQTANVPISGPSLVLVPHYELVSDASGDGLVDAGDMIRVTVRYSNVGTETTSNVVLSSRVDPTQFEISQAEQDGEISSEQGTVTWKLSSIEAGSSGEVSYLARVRTFPEGLAALSLEVAITSDQVQVASRQLQIVITAPTPEPGAAATPGSSVVFLPEQGQGLLTSYSIAILVGAFLCLSLLAIVYVASRVLPSTPQERESLDTEEERTANRRLVRELVEGIVLTAILFSVMVLGLQNALDRNSINSIIAGIVGYVAGRVASQR